MLNIFGISIAGSIYGYNIGISPGLISILKETSVTNFQISMFVSSFLWGICSILLLSGFLANAIGRKKLILLSGTTAVFSLLLFLFSTSVEQLTASRFLQGVAVGISNIATPLYISEIIPPRYRGRGVMAYQLFLCFGILFATGVSFFLYNYNSIKILFVFIIIPIIIFILSTLRLPESPRWLFDKGCEEDAFSAFKLTRSLEDAKSCIEQMKQLKHTNSNKLKFKIKFVLPIIFVMLIGALNQFSGINVFLQYNSFIFGLLNFSSKSFLMFGGVVIALLNFVITAITIFIVDKVERRRLLQLGLIGISICLIIAGLSTSKYFPHNPTVTVLCLLGYIIFYALGPGALIWSFLSEVIPSNIRSIGMGIGLTISAASGATFSGIFLELVNKIGISGIFFMCGSISVIHFLLSNFIPDTKGKSLEQIESSIKN